MRELAGRQGPPNKEVAVETGLDRRQVALWRQRFLDGGIDALRKDAPRSGRPATITAEVESRILHATMRDKPVYATRWGTRTPAEHLTPTSASSLKMVERFFRDKVARAEATLATAAG